MKKNVKSIFIVRLAIRVHIFFSQIRIIGAGAHTAEFVGEPRTRVLPFTGHVPHTSELIILLTPLPPRCSSSSPDASFPHGGDWWSSPWWRWRTLQSSQTKGDHALGDPTVLFEYTITAGIRGYAYLYRTELATPVSRSRILCAPFLHPHANLHTFWSVYRLLEHAYRLLKSYRILIRPLHFSRWPFQELSRTTGFILCFATGDGSRGGWQTTTAATVPWGMGSAGVWNAALEFGSTWRLSHHSKTGAQLLRVLCWSLWTSRAKSFQFLKSSGYGGSSCCRCCCGFSRIQSIHFQRTWNTLSGKKNFCMLIYYGERCFLSK